MPPVTRRGVLLFATLSVVWGIPYLLIKVSVAEVEPVVLVLARTAVGAAVLLPFALHRRALGAALRHWRAVLAYAAIEVMVPWFLLSDAERHVSSSLAGLVIAATPLLGAALAWVLTRERLGGVRLVGLLTGLAGVAALLGLDLAAGADGLALAELVLTAVFYAVGPVIVTRWLGAVPALGVNALALTAAALVYLPLALPRLPPALPSAAALGSLAVLGLVCTAGALLLFFALIAEVGAARALVITYVNPAVALALGVWLLDEPLTTGLLVGFPLVLAGSVLATWQSRPARTPERAGA
jgi:drug/metabolite transporter (DMT)-like permease